MSNKLSLLLGLIFVLFISLFGIDLSLIQANYASLDALSETVSFKISNYGINSEGEINQAIINFLKEENNVQIKSDNKNTNFVEGDLYKYILYKEYNPIFIAKEPINISITRYAVIGINEI